MLSALKQAVRHWVVLPIAFFLTLSAWAITAPVGAAPDDDYHLASIWCAQGEREGRCLQDPTDPAQFFVPIAVFSPSECFRFKPDVSAACADEALANTALTHTDRVNTGAGLYPTGFYSVMSVVVGDDVTRSVVAMRLFNALIAALLLAAVLRLTPVGIGAAAALAIAVTYVPLGLSIIPTTNPSSWAFTGIATVWALSLAFLRTQSARSRRGLLLGALTLAAGGLAIAARADAALYVVLALFLVVTRNGWRRTIAMPGRTALLAALVIAAAVTYLMVAPVSVLGVADEGEALGQNPVGWELLARNLSDLPQLWVGVVGNWPLGWYDIVMPGLVPVAGAVVVGALLMWGLAAPDRTKAVAVAISAAALTLVPLVFLHTQHLVVGEVVQPRYIAPLLTLLIAMLALGARIRRPQLLPAAPAWIIGTALSLSAVMSLWVWVHRYAWGNEIGRFDLTVPAAWLPPGPFPLPLIVTVGALASVVFIAGAVARSRP